MAFLKAIANKFSPQLRHIATGGIAIALLLGIPSTSLAQSDSELAYRVKAAFIYNFTKFTRWPDASPAATNATFNVCVAGSEKLHTAVKKAVSNKIAWGKALTSEYIDHLGNVSNCQVIFLGFSDRRKIQNWISSTENKQVLTISDNKDFIKTGGIIQLVIVGGKVRFDINQSALAKSQLEMSSKLLSLARNTRQ